MTEDELLLEMAWGVIANAGGGDWKKESEVWQKAAASFRDRYFDLFRGPPSPGPKWDPAPPESIK